MNYLSYLEKCVSWDTRKSRYPVQVSILGSYLNSYIFTSDSSQCLTSHEPYCMSLGVIVPPGYIPTPKDPMRELVMDFVDMIKPIGG